MPKSDLRAVTIIGALAGLLVQPVLANNLPQGHMPGIGGRAIIFFAFLVFAPFALWVAHLISKIAHSVYQFAKFAAVGTLNTFIDLGVINLEIFLHGTTLVSNPVFAAFKAVSFLCSTTNSFVWNKYWTFSSGGKMSAGEVSGFYGVALVGWGLNVGFATFIKAIGPQTSHLWVSVVAPLAGVAASFLWNFIGYKYWVFGRRKPAAPDDTGRI